MVPDHTLMDDSRTSPGVDSDTAVVVLAVWTAWIYSAAVLDHSTEVLTTIRFVIVTALVVFTARRTSLFTSPVIPRWMPKRVVVGGGPYIAAVFFIVGLFVVDIVAKTGAREAVELVRAPAGGVTYNDVAFTQNPFVVDVVNVWGAAAGEELIFRGVLLAIAVRYMDWRLAVIAQAIVFGFAHTGFEMGYSAGLVAGIMVTGVLFGWATMVTKSLWPSIVAHAAWNLLVTLVDHNQSSALFLVIVIAALLSGVAIHLWLRRGRAATLG